MYIGNQEVKMTMPEGKTLLKVEFDDKSSTVINKELFDLIKSEEKGVGNVTDNVNHYFSKKFIAELSMYDLEFYFAGSVGTAMGVLVHNLRENLFQTTFKCGSTDNIGLKKLVSQSDKK